MFGVFDLLVCIGIGVGISWAEQDAFAEVHQAHQNAGDGDDDQRREKISGVRNEL